MIEAFDKLKLWFFRDLDNPQRNKFFALFGYPESKTHGVQMAQLRSLKPPPSAEPMYFAVETWKTSFGADYFVAMTCGDRKMTVYHSRERYQAEYHCAEFRWLAGQGDKPEIMDYTEETHPNTYPNEHVGDNGPLSDYMERLAEAIYRAQWPHDKRPWEKDGQDEYQKVFRRCAQAVKAYLF